MPEGHAQEELMIGSRLMKLSVDCGILNRSDDNTKPNSEGVTSENCWSKESGTEYTEVETSKPRRGFVKLSYLRRRYSGVELELLQIRKKWFEEPWA